MNHTKYWLLSLVSALVILVLLGLHMAMMHLDGILATLIPSWSEPLVWENILERGRSGFFALTYVILLAALSYHGLYGLYTILTEYWTSHRASRIISACCWALGITLFVVGSSGTVLFHLSQSSAGLY